jgi:hypothetical protein
MPTYTYTTIEGGAAGINNSGDIVGSYTDNSGIHGYLYSHGVYTTIDVPGSDDFNIHAVPTALMRSKVHLMIRTQLRRICG